MNRPDLSIRTLLGRYRGSISVTWILVVIEAALLVLFPYAMGEAVDDYLDGSWRGLNLLIGLGLGMLVVGASRRYYDTRIYARMYREIAPELVTKERARQSTVSTISARAGLAAEFVEYLENSMPMIFNAILGLFGTLVVIAIINLNVFLSCLLATAGIALVFLVSRGATFRFNQGYNEEIENRVRVIEERNDDAIADHFRSLMKWNIRLSDLETKNFSISWVFLMGVLVFAIIEPVRQGGLTIGATLSLLMYVFGYIETILEVPLHYQQFVRLEEISNRLSGKQTTQAV